MKAGSLISNSQPNDPNSNEAGTEIVPVLPGITLHRPALSRGPLSVLYRGWDKTHHCEVIAKVQRATEDAVTQSRFGREAAVMVQLRHPSIVSLYAFHPGDPSKNDPAALVMEYVPGQTLAALISGGGFLSPARATQIIEEIAAALDCVHGIGIVHRDVKPSNILVPKHGPAKLTDFGVARIDDDLPLTVMGDVLGTIEYASPEQVHGNDAVNTRSDVYSLAAVTYFVLTGTPPFRAADASTQAQLSVMHRQVFAEPPPLRLHRPDLSPAIEAAVLRGLAKAPEDRYESAGQLAAALRAAISSADPPQQVAAELSARRTGALAGALASAVLLLGGFALWKTSERTPSVSLAPVQTAKPHPVIPAAAPIPVATSQTAKIPLASTAPVKPLIVPVKPPVKPAQIAQILPSAVKPTVHHPLALLSYPLVLPAQIAAAPPLYTSKMVRRLAHATPSLLAPVAAQEVPQKTAPPVVLPVIAPVPLNAAAPSSATVSLPAANPPPTLASRVGWYAVSGWIALTKKTPLQNAELVQASPLWIKVDGKPYPALASGRWAELSAGKHTVTYQPFGGLGVGPKTWDIDLAPSAHLSQQIPLPTAPLPKIPTHLRNP